jgi:hypothetical protein
MRTRVHAQSVGLCVHDLGVHVLLTTYYDQVEHPLDEAALRLVQGVGVHWHERVVVQDLNHREIQIVAPICLGQEGVRWEQEMDLARPLEVQIDCDRVLYFLD